MKEHCASSANTAWWTAHKNIQVTDIYADRNKRNHHLNIYANNKYYKKKQ